MSRNIVITGASSDIGLAISTKIIRPEDQVILQCFRNPDKCNQLKEKLKDSCNIIISDFSDPESIENFCKQLPEIDILINAAGSTITNLLPNFSDKDILKMLYVNIFALTKICQAVIPAMIVKRKGCIVNISSIAATRGNKGQSVYAGTKGFVESFSRSLTSEYGSRGIRINCVAPGPIDAGSLKELLSYAAEDVNESIISKRLGNPDDVASAVEFLCSEEAEFINGKCIQVDGGFMRGI